MAVHLEIIETDKHPLTGYVTVVCRVIDDSDPTHGVGAVEKFGVEALDIQKNFDGSVERWLKERVGSIMLANHQARAAVHTDVHKFKGKKIALDI